VNVLQAIVIVPVRREPVVLAATEYWTVPFPDPLAPDVIVIQLALLAAVHAHPALVVTRTLPAPPPEPKFALLGEIA
jgi:hypothetical protein